MLDHPVHDIPPVGDPYRWGLWHKDRAHWRGFFYETLSLRRPRRRLPEAVKFLIFGRARSGTTLLVGLLNQVEAIRCDGEVLHWKVVSPRRYLNRLAASAEAQAYGCKFLSYQLLEVQKLRRPVEFFHALVDDGFRIIHIVRGTFQQSLSLSVAQARRFYHVKTGAEGAEGVPEIDVDRFVQQIRYNEALLDYERRILETIPHIVIDYDAELAEQRAHQATVDRICAYLGVESGPVLASLGKTRGERSGYVLGNFGEIKHRLRAEGYGALLPAAAPASGEG